MNKRLDNKIQMFWVVLKILLKYKTLWETIKMYADAFNDFSQYLKTIEKTAIVAGVSTTGITEGKNSLKDELVLEIYRVDSLLRLIASRPSNPVLKSKVNMSESDLKNLTQPKLVLKAHETEELAMQYVTPELNGGKALTEPNLLTILTDTYADAIPAPKVSITERKNANEKLGALFTETTKHIEDQIDTFVEQYRKSNPDLYNEYWNARNIIEYGVRHETTDTSADTSTAGTTTKKA